MDDKKYQNLLMIKYGRTKINDKLDFKVIEINNDHALCEYVDYPEIKGKVDYEQLSRGFALTPHDHFEVGDVFEGKVLFKEMNKTLRILPTLNLAEQKRNKAKQHKLESWMTNGKEV